MSTLFFLHALPLIDMPRLRGAVGSVLMPDDAERWLPVWERITRTVSRWAIGAIVVATIAGTVQGGTALLLGSSYWLALAFIAGALDLIPMIGATIAGFILVPTVLAEEGVVDAVIMLVVILVYQQLENNVVNPAIGGRRRRSRPSSSSSASRSAPRSSACSALSSLCRSRPRSRSSRGSSPRPGRRRCGRHTPRTRSGVTPLSLPRSSRRPSYEGRMITARILVVFAVLFAVLGLVAGFIRWQALDNETFEATAEQLIADDDVRNQVASTLVDELYANVDVAEGLEERLPEDQQALAPILAGALRELSDRAARRLLERPRPQLWVRSLSGTHAQLLRLLDDELTTVQTQDGYLVLNLRPLVIQLGDQVAIVGRLAERLPPTRVWSR